jgi:hypothetical protein
MPSLYRTALRISTWTDQVFYTTAEDDRPHTPVVVGDSQEHGSAAWSNYLSMRTIKCDELSAKYQDGVLWIKGRDGSEEFEVSYQGPHTVDWKPFDLSDPQDKREDCALNENDPRIHVGRNHPEATPENVRRWQENVDQANAQAAAPFASGCEGCPQENDETGDGCAGCNIGINHAIIPNLEEEAGITYLLQSGRKAYITSANGDSLRIWADDKGLMCAELQVENGKVVTPPLCLDPQEDDPHSYGYLIEDSRTIWIRSSNGEQVHLWTDKYGEIFAEQFESDEPVV